MHDPDASESPSSSKSTTEPQGIPSTREDLTAVTRAFSGIIKARVEQQGSLQQALATLETCECDGEVQCRISQTSLRWELHCLVDGVWKSMGISCEPDPGGGVGGL
ncbi:MAG: hypothetical protein ACR2GY_05105 [Phycisphaerales bacterium]